jgi:hypothetical protein
MLKQQGEDSINYTNISELITENAQLKQIINNFR